MIEVLKINDWVSLRNCSAQFIFIDEEDKSIAERLSDDFVFFVGDEVCYINGYSEIIKTSIKKFDEVSRVLVYLDNGAIIRISEIEESKYFDI